MISTAEELAVQIEDTASYEQLANPIIFASLVAIEFAKMHVEAQNKAILEKTELDSYEFKEDWMEEPFNCTIDDLGNINAISRESILNAYPLTNIK